MKTEQKRAEIIKQAKLDYEKEHNIKFADSEDLKQFLKYNLKEIQPALDYLKDK